MKSYIGTIILALAGMMTMEASADTTARDAKRISLVAASPLAMPVAEPVNGAMKVVVPQKDLETAIRTSREGDILIYDGANAWYHVDGHALQSGTRVFVLGTGSLVSVFPKEASDEAIR